MERVKRRWWTMLTFALAGMVILAALVSGLFQTAVYLLPNYRDDLAVWVTKVADRPVQIGGIALVWRGAAPILDLSDITLYGEDGAEEILSAQRLSLGTSLWRLFTGDLRPSRIELSGLTLNLRIDERGHLSLVGFDTPGEFSREDAEKWLRQLDRFEDLRLENCELGVEQTDGTVLRFALRRFDVDRTLAGFDAEASMGLPEAYGDDLSFESTVRGELTKPELWRGEFSASATGLLPQPWLRGLVAPGTAAGVDSMEARLKGTLDGGRLAAMTLQLDAENLLVARAGDQQNAESLHGQLELSRGTSGWRIELTQLLLDDEELLKGGVRFLPLDEGFDLAAEAEQLQLGRLAPYLRYARGLPPALAALAGLQGGLSGLNLRLRHDLQGTRYSARAQLDEVSLAPTPAGYAVQGLNGRLTADSDGGRLVLLPGPLQARLPILKTPELPFEALSGALHWSHDDNGWLLSMPQFGWKLAGSGGNGRFSLRLPAAADASPELDLGANFTVGDLLQLKPWMPAHWSRDLQSYLERAVRGGRVTRGQLAVRGALRDFPFTRGNGEWRLDAAVSGGRLDYADGWPELEDLQAQLAFRGNSLTVTADAGEIAGNPIEQASAHFADFHEHLLTVDARASGEIARYYQLLRESPIAQRLSGLLDNTRASGPARVGLHLDIPLSHHPEVKVNGTVELDGAQLYYASLEEPVNEIHGLLAFDSQGVSADRLSARFTDVALEARIEPRAGTHGVVLAEFPYSLNVAGEGLSGFVPDLVRRHLGGEARYRVELPLGGERTVLALTSNLRGVESTLPQPLAKSANDAVNLRVGIGGEPAEGLRVQVEYENRLGADVLMQKQPGQPAQVFGVNLRLGAGEAPPLATTGLTVRGQAAELDVPAWSAALKGAAESQGLPLRAVDLSAERWNFQGQIVRGARAQLTPVAEGWDIKLDGPGAEGAATLRKGSESAAGKLSAQLSRLVVEAPALLETSDAAAAAAAVAKPTRPPLDPNSLPVLDLNVGKLSFNGNDYGGLRLVTSRLPRGQKIDSVKVDGSTLNASGGGEWLRDNNQSSGRFKFEANSGDFTSVLKSFGYAESLTARQAQLRGDVQWEPATGAGGIEWTQARGRVDFAFESGSVKAVEPGAGRMLGLFNFYALPRRLTLDFRDVVSEGLGYDRIVGHFDLAGGNATTDDLAVHAPSLRMEMRGRVGLAARDYDQHVSVYPDIGPGATIGAALLGGPALAAIAFIAQEVLEKPLDQATQFSYQLTGSWDNPQVKRVGAPSAEAVITRPRS